MSSTIKPEELFYKAVQENDLTTVRDLISNNPDLDLNYVPENDWEANTAFLSALSKENMEMAFLLLEHKASPWKLNNFGLNTLHMLAMVHKDMTKEKAEKVKTLLTLLSKHKEFNEEINRPGQTDGRTPLAMVLAYPETAEWLTSLWNEFTKYQAKYASNEKSMWAVWLNSTNRHDKISFFEKTFPEQFKIEFLYQKSTDLFVGKSGLNALNAAISSDNFNLVKYVFEKGGSDWLKIINHDKNPAPPMHLALDCNPINKEILLYLLQKGANPEIPNPPDKEKKNVLQRLEFLKDKGFNDAIKKNAAEILEDKEILSFLKPKAKFKP